MSIYELKNKEFRTVLRDFSKGMYGKVVFCLAYSIPLLSIIVAVEMFILSKISVCYSWCYSPFIIIALFVSFASFILGSRYYYKELRKFYETEYKRNE